MITSVRIEASGDDPGDVKRILDSALIRIGLGIGEVVDEVYERRGLGYDGRLKVNYDVPHTSDLEDEWNQETEDIRTIVLARLARRQEQIESNVGFTGNWTGSVASVELP